MESNRTLRQIRGRDLDAIAEFIDVIREISAGRWVPPPGSVAEALVESHPGGPWFGLRALRRFARLKLRHNRLWWLERLTLDVGMLVDEDRAVIIFEWSTFVEESAP